MISAKNFAAQAERGLRLQAGLQAKSKISETAEYCNMCADHIAGSVHFAVPDGGKIFNDGLKGLHGMPLRLPFPSMTVEFCPVAGKKTLIMVFQEETKIMVNYAQPSPLAPDTWIPSTAMTRLPNLETFSPEEFTKSEIEYQVMAPEIWSKLEQSTRDATIRECVSLGVTILELLEALTCRNVSLVNHQEASPVNPKRIKVGKLPIYETKVLVVDTGDDIGETIRTGRVVHASPRQHLRRGHIRRLLAGNIWVNSCVVGSLKKGIIDKSYLVK